MYKGKYVHTCTCTAACTVSRPGQTCQHIDNMDGTSTRLTLLQKVLHSEAHNCSRQSQGGHKIGVGLPVASSGLRIGVGKTGTKGAQGRV